MQTAPIAPEAVDGPAVAADDELIPEEMLTEELLIEEISIDGMCGVY